MRTAVCGDRGFSMRLAIRFLGMDFLDVTIETDPAADYDEPGDCVSTAFGFQPSPGDQRWETGADLGE